MNKASMKSDLQTSRDWKSWQPERLRQALRREILCGTKGCGATYVMAEGVDRDRWERQHMPVVKCPACQKQSVMMSRLAWNPGSVRCSRCRREAPVRWKHFRRNVGLLLVRLEGEEEGLMCRPCIDATYWRFTSVTAILGWWSITSLFLAPWYLITNTWQFFTTLGMKAPPVGANRPQVSAEGAQRLNEMQHEILADLERGRSRDKVGATYAERAGIPCSQAMPLIQTMVLDAIADELPART